MYIERSKNPYQKNWWNGQIVRLVVYISRNDLMWIGVYTILAVLYFKFLPSMDWVFGLRP